MRSNVTHYSGIYVQSHDLPSETEIVFHKMPLTSGAERAVVGSGGAVAQVAVVLLHALPSVLAVHPKTSTVALATGLDPRCDLSPLVQIEGDAVHP